MDTTGPDVTVERSKHLRTLTAMRFVAALYVVLHHSIGPNHPFGIRSGYLGVTFFFVLSGFVLTWSHKPGMRARDFWRNRVARIVPTYWLLVLVGAVVPLAGPVNVTSILTSLTMTQSWSMDKEVIHGTLAPAWSLSTEAFFYLAFPLAIVLGRRYLTTPARIVAGAVVTWFGFAVCDWGVYRYVGAHAYNLTYTFPAYRFGEFAIGIMLALLWRTGWRPRVSFHAIGALGLVIVTAAFAADWHLNPLRRDHADLVLIPAVVCILWWAVAAEDAGRTTRWTPEWLVKLGEWSYALYLLHALVIRVIAAVIGGEAGYLPAWGVVVTVIVSIALSALISERFEKPLEKRLRTPKRAQAQELGLPVGAVIE